MRTRLLVVLVLPLAFLAGVGCQRVRYENTYTLNPHDSQELTLDAPAYSQRVTVTIVPTSGPVSAYLVKSADLLAVKAKLDAEKEPDASLLLGSRVSKDRAEEYTFEATVPAKTEYTLIVKAGKATTDVKVK